MDIKTEIGNAYADFQNENYRESINKSVLLIPELNRELQGIVYFLIANCHMQLREHEDAYDACKHAADRGNADALAHLPQLQALLDL